MEKLGRKFDNKKPRFSLIPLGVLAQAIAVLEYGAEKYNVDNWKHVDNARERYFDALHRHLSSWYYGEKIDEESGHPHLAHVLCCVMFLLWFDYPVEKKREAE